MRYIICPKPYLIYLRGTIGGRVVSPLSEIPFAVVTFGISAITIAMTVTIIVAVTTGTVVSCRAYCRSFSY